MNATRKPVARATPLATVATVATITEGDAHRGSRQAGVTLIELMVVVMIIGVLMAAGSVALNRKAKAADVGHTIAGMLNETSRKAVTWGPVEPAALAAMDPPKGARTRLVIETAGGFEAARIERMDDAAPTTWPQVTARYIGNKGIDVAGFSNVAQLSAGTTPDNPLDVGDTVAIHCFPDGSCEPITLYLQSVDDPDNRARVVLMPLNSASQVFDSW